MNAMLKPLIDSWWQWQVSVLWQGLAAFLLLALVWRWVSSWPLRWRYSLLLVVLAKCVLVWPLSLPLPWPSSAASNAGKPVAFETAGEPQSSVPPLASAPNPPRVSASASTPNPLEGAVPFTQPSLSERLRLLLNWKVSLFLLWLAGVTVTTARIGGGFLQLARLRNKSRLDLELSALSREAGRRIGLRRDVPVYVTPAPCSPLIFGLFRPAVLIPEHCAALPANARTLLLCHELAHVARFDQLVALLRSLAIAAVWWNPAVHILTRWILSVAEQCCDSRVLELHPNRHREYGSLLVDVVESTWRKGTFSFTPAFSETNHLFRRRLRNIAAVSRGLPHPSGYAYASLLLLCALLLPGWILTAPAQNDSEWPGRFVRLDEHAPELQAVRFPISTFNKYDGYPDPRFSSDQRFLIAKISQGPVHLLDLKENKIKTSFGGREEGYRNDNDSIVGVTFWENVTRDFSWAPDGKHFFLSTHEKGLLWNTETDQQEAEFLIDDPDAPRVPGQPHYVHPGKPYFISSAFSPDGRYLAAGLSEALDVDWAKEKEVGSIYRTYLYDTATGNRIHEFQHDSPASVVRFSPDGKRLLTAFSQGSIRMWDVETKAVLAETGIAMLMAVAFFPDGKRISLGIGNQNHLTIKDASTLQDAGTIPFPVKFIAPEAIVFSPHGDRLLVRDIYGRVFLWELLSQTESPSEAVQGRFIGVLADRFVSIVGAAFSADAESIITFSTDGVLAYWNAESGEYREARQGDWYRPAIRMSPMVPDLLQQIRASARPETPIAVPLLDTPLPGRIAYHNEPLLQVAKDLESRVKGRIDLLRWRPESITLEMDNPTLKEVLDTMLPPLGLDYTAYGDRTLLIDRRAVTERLQNKQMPEIPFLQAKIPEPLYFDYEPVESFAKTLQELTGVPIKFEEGIASTKIVCQIWRDMPLQHVLDQVLPVFNLDYRVMNGTVIIHSLP